jgi:sugar phosphate permease
VRTTLLRFFPTKLIPWIVWTIAVFYYLYEYVLRISPAVMVSQIMQDLHIDTTNMGNLSAVYFYVYGAMQIPVGILVHKYGPKPPLVCGALLITLGNCLFSYSHILLLSYFGRALIGFGSSFGYLCCLKLIVNWFKSNRFAFMCSLVNMVGMIGAFAGEVILSHLMNILTWRQLLFHLSYVGLLIITLLLLFVKNFPTHRPSNLEDIHAVKASKIHPNLKQTFNLKRSHFSRHICRLYLLHV